MGNFRVVRLWQLNQLFPLSFLCSFLFRTNVYLLCICSWLWPHPPINAVSKDGTYLKTPVMIGLYYFFKIHHDGLFFMSFTCFAVLKCIFHDGVTMHGILRMNITSSANFLLAHPICLLQCDLGQYMWILLLVICWPKNIFGYLDVLSRHRAVGKQILV